MFRFQGHSLSCGGLLLLGLLNASIVSGGALYTFDTSNTGKIPYWNGTPASGWDGWHTPPQNLVAGSVQASVVTYGQAANAAGALPDPSGGTQALALAGTPSGSVTRAQHGFDFSQSDIWTVSFDLLLLNGSPTDAADLDDWIVGFTPLSTAGTGANFNVLAGWDSDSSETTWSSYYYAYDSSGNPLGPNGISPGAAWSGLSQNRWHNESTTFDLATDRILSISITDIASGLTTTETPEGWYMHNLATEPDVFRFSGFGSTNGALIDNVDLTSVPEPALWTLAGLGLAALCVRGKRRSCM